MKSNSKNFSKIVLITIFFLILLVAFVKIDYDRSINKSNSDSNEKATVEISEGESVDNIINDLIDTDLLQKRYFYYAKIYIKVNGLGEKLQAGIYELPKQLSIKELIEALQLGRTQDIWVSIPEGLRKDEIADIVAEELSGEESSFSTEEFLSLTENQEYINSLGLAVNIDDLEGFLFPDTYTFTNDTTTETVIETLVENFKTKVGDQYTYEDIILASIVEREGYNGEDRPVIAGIIIKRYEEGWLLQADATLLYPVKDWKHTITAEDKSSDSPYNTYKVIGLPPTPICNSGLESIQAVWDPVDTDYYYYIHDEDGNPYYGRTLEEHNLNVSTYLR